MGVRSDVDNYEVTSGLGLVYSTGSFAAFWSLIPPRSTSSNGTVACTLDCLSWHRCYMNTVVEGLELMIADAEK